MNINTLIDSLETAISTDSETSAWCMVHYTNPHKTYIGVNGDLPAAENAPYVVIAPRAKQVGHRVSQKSHVFDVACYLYDENETVLSDPDIVRYDGVENIETFRKLVETAISEMDIGNVEINTIDVEYDPVSFFPFFEAGMVIEFLETHTLGSDIFE